MLSVGDRLPDFDVALQEGTDLPEEGFMRVNQNSFDGQWKILFFWPKDFTFICPTEILAFDELVEDFAKLNAIILGASTDTDFVHLAWRRSREDLGAVRFPWIADVKKELTNALGVLDREEGVAQRATFIVDPENTIQHVYVTNLNVGRNPQDTLRVLDALQTDELCPCNRTVGGETLAA